MAKNRRHIDREEKRRHLVDVAADLFVAGGYHETTMVDVAKAAGVASNTVYWYFKRKDVLLAAVVESLLATELNRYISRAGRPLEENLPFVLDRLSALRPLALPMRELRTTSKEVAGVHDRFRGAVHHAGTSYLRDQGLSPEDASCLVLVWEYVLEGLLLQAADDEQRARVCDYLLGVTRRELHRSA